MHHPPDGGSKMDINCLKLGKKCNLHYHNCTGGAGGSSGSCIFPISSRPCVLITVARKRRHSTGTPRPSRGLNKQQAVRWCISSNQPSSTKPLSGWVHQPLQRKAVVRRRTLSGSLRTYLSGPVRLSSQRTGVVDSGDTLATSVCVCMCQCVLLHWVSAKDVLHLHFSHRQRAVRCPVCRGGKK